MYDGIIENGVREKKKPYLGHRSTKCRIMCANVGTKQKGMIVVAVVADDPRSQLASAGAAVVL